MKKTGLLLHISCLPNGYGMGNFGKAAFEFVDYLYENNQRYWQILPLNPIGLGYSPYQSVSTFAINPYLIDLYEFVELGILSEKDLHNNILNTREIDYEKTLSFYNAVLNKAFIHGYDLLKWEIHDFAIHHPWIKNYAEFMALKESNSFMVRQNGAEKQKSEQKQQYYYFVQYIAYTQYEKLKKYANSKNISIIGDMPIYVSEDSADVWSNPKEFLMDSQGIPTKRAGVPPDYFSEEGQFWGNPLYDYKAMRKNGFQWWRNRLIHALSLYDIVRIDHFRAFAAYWAVTGKTAKEGQWIRGAGREILNSMSDFLNPKRIIAEDLGIITKAVDTLRKDFGFLGMKVLQFAFATKNSRHKYLPHNYPEDCVAYSGTHDNDTLASFIQKGGREIDNAKSYYKTCNPILLHDIMLRSLVESKAKIVIIPAQDILGLKEGRMNTPSTVSGNWLFRLLPHEMENRSKYLKSITS